MIANLNEEDNDDDDDDKNKTISINLRKKISHNSMHFRCADKLVRVHQLFYDDEEDEDDNIQKTIYPM